MHLSRVPRAGQMWLTSDLPISTPEEVEAAYRAVSGSDKEIFTEVCEGLPEAETYIREHAHEYGWTTDLITRARRFTPQVLEPPVPYFRPYWSCYENSFNYAKEKGLLYVEGIAINPTGVQVHAWNSTDGTDVLDYTWPFQHVNKYFGVIFDTEWMMNNVPIPGGLLAYLHEEAQADERQGTANFFLQKFRAEHPHHLHL